MSLLFKACVSLLLKEYVSLLFKDVCPYYSRHVSLTHSNSALLPSHYFSGPLSLLFKACEPDSF